MKTCSIFFASRWQYNIWHSTGTPKLEKSALKSANNLELISILFFFFQPIFIIIWIMWIIWIRFNLSLIFRKFYNFSILDFMYANVSSVGEMEEILLSFLECNFCDEVQKFHIWFWNEHTLGALVWPFSCKLVLFF